MECKSRFSNEGITIWQAESDCEPRTASNSSGRGQISTVLNLKTWFLGSQNSATTWRNGKLIFLVCMDQNTDRWNGSNLDQDSPPKLFKIGCRVLKLLSDIFWGFQIILGAGIGENDEEEVRDSRANLGLFVGTDCHRRGDRLYVETTPLRLKRRHLYGC